MIPRLTGPCPKAALRVTLPLPPFVLSGNGRANEHVRARAAAQAFQDGERAMRASLGHYDPPAWSQVAARATFFFRTAMRRDDDNWQFALKHYRDGMAHVLGIDDSCWRWVETRLEVDRGDPRVEVVVGPRAAGEDGQ